MGLTPKTQLIYVPLFLARVLTVSEAEQNRTSLEGFLFGYDVVMLEDGLFYGPKHG